MDKSKPQIFPQAYPSVSCDTFGCYQRSKWSIGRPDAPLNLCINLCDKCMESVIGLIPDQLKEAFVPKEGTVLVDAEFLQGLIANQKPAEPEGIADAESDAPPPTELPKPAPKAAVKKK